MNSSWHSDANVGDNSPASLNRDNPVLAAFRLKQPHRRSPSKIIGGDSGLIHEIHSFSDNLRTDIVPQFDELEAKLSDSLGGFQRQLESFDAVQSKTQEVVENFKIQVMATQKDLEAHLQKLDQWSKQDRDIVGFDARLRAAREKLANCKTRLDVVAESMRISDESERRNMQVRLFGNIILSIFVAFVALLWYYLKRSSII